MSYPPPGQPQHGYPQQQYFQPAGPQQWEPPPGYAQQATPPRRKRRVFLWVFLAIQALFLIWVITGVAGGSSIHSEAVAYCHAHPDQYLPFSQCVSDYGGGAKVGAAVGVGLVVAFWAVVDVILGVSYGIWRLARR